VQVMTATEASRRFAAVLGEAEQGAFGDRPDVDARTVDRRRPAG
jgi:hypothetical protein